MISAIIAAMGAIIAGTNTVSNMIAVHNVVVASLTVGL